MIKFIRTLAIIGAYLIVYLFSLNTVNAQISSGGQPYSFTDKSINNSQLKSITNNSIQITDLDLNVVKNEVKDLNDCKECKSGFYYGKEVNVNVNFFDRATKYDYSDDEYVWILKFKSEEAKGYQFIFDKFYIPEGGKLFIYNEERDMLLGAFTSANNREDLTFLTQHINGKNVYIEYVQPKKNEALDQISVEKVVYIFTDNFSSLQKGTFKENGASSFQKNTACFEDDGLDAEIKSVVLILMKYEEINQKPSFWGACSGVLVNDGNNYRRRQKPYVISANHCYQNPYTGLVDSSDPSDWLFVFRHESLSCKSSGSEDQASIAKSVRGAKVLLNDKGSIVNDLLLLQLDNTVEEVSRYDIAFAGYNFNTISLDSKLVSVSKPLVFVHHPRADVKKLSKSVLVPSLIRVKNTLGGYTPISGGDNFWSVSTTDGFYSESGSSGSPLFDSNHRIIAVLRGGDEFGNTSTLDPKIKSHFGRLSKTSVIGLNYFAKTESDSYIPEVGYCEAGSFDFSIVNPQVKYAPGSTITFSEKATLPKVNTEDFIENPDPKSYYFDPYCSRKLQPIYAGIGRRTWAIDGINETSDVFNTIRGYAGMSGDIGPKASYYLPQNKQISFNQPGVHNVKITLNLANYFQKGGERACFPVPENGRNYRFGPITTSQADAYTGSVRVVVADCDGRKTVNSITSPYLSIASSDEKEVGAGHIDVDQVKFVANTSYALEAYQSITLKIGTEIPRGTTFSAKIISCPALPRMTELRDADVDTYTDNVEEYLITENKVTVYPNPTSGIVSIKTENGVKVDRVDVYDISGRLVIKSSDIVNPYAFYLNQLGNGVYLMKVRTNFGITDHKIILKK